MISFPAMVFSGTILFQRQFPDVLPRSRLFEPREEDDVTEEVDDDSSICSIITPQEQEEQEQ